MRTILGWFLVSPMLVLLLVFVIWGIYHLGLWAFEFFDNFPEKVKDFNLKKYLKKKIEEITDIVEMEQFIGFLMILGFAMFVIGGIILDWWKQ